VDPSGGAAPLAVRDCGMHDGRPVDPDGDEPSFGEPAG
jgi:hypothetical protein